MQKRMKLKGQIRLEQDRSLTFLSKMHDGTPFSLRVDVHDFEQNEEFRADKLTVDGWLFVLQEAQQDTRCYLTLPKPSIAHGKQVIVHELQLMRHGMTIADFGPKKSGGKAKIAPDPSSIS